jgi:predicted nuclease with TOPRIM domain
MAHRLLWAVAILTAAMALVAGCFAPKEPLVVIGTQRDQPAPQDISRIQAMDRPTLEQEFLRFQADNAYLQNQVDKLKRENKQLKDEKKQLEDQVKDLRKR